MAERPRNSETLKHFRKIPNLHLIKEKYYKEVRRGGERGASETPPREAPLQDKTSKTQDNQQEHEAESSRTPKICQIKYLSEK